MVNDVSRILPHQRTGFFSVWTLYWVISMILFDVLDILTTFVPQQYMSFCMFTWMITNGKSYNIALGVALDSNISTLQYQAPAAS